MSDDDERQEPQRRPDDWSPEEKLAAVTEASGISEQDLGVWLRRKGLREDHLSEWRELALEGVAARPARPDPEERKRVKALERELQRKEKALAETAALLVLQRKMQALWEERDNPTRQKSDVQPSKPSRKRKKRGPR